MVKMKVHRPPQHVEVLELPADYAGPGDFLVQVSGQPPYAVEAANLVEHYRPLTSNAESKRLYTLAKEKRAHVVAQAAAEGAPLLEGEPPEGEK